MWSVLFMRCAGQSAAAASPRLPESARGSGGRMMAATAVFEPFGVIAAHHPQIGARPDKAVDLAHDRPGARFIEAEAPLHRRRKLDGIGGVLRRTMRDRQHGHDRPSAVVPGNEDNRAGPVLDPLFALLPILRLPKIRIADDEAGLGSRERHT